MTAHVSRRHRHLRQKRCGRYRGTFVTPVLVISEATVGPRIRRQGERAYATTLVSGHKQLQCGWEFGGFQEYPSRVPENQPLN
ncbi:Uncharacterized protein HZ326_29099 [Fusarium oxysporum f. sp. albedinis]|nr:Uncharacterized protein HZ326_29099 [Fusarium oxysporum f. sp. albedinis]